MANDWKQIFSDAPVLQASIICQDITTNMDGQRTFHQELYSIPQKGIDQFILVQLWRGNNITDATFKEVIDLHDPDGNIISTTKTPDFHLYGPSYRHYNLYSYHSFHFHKKGTYEFKSKLYKQNHGTPIIHENFIVVT